MSTKYAIKKIDRTGASYGGGAYIIQMFYFIYRFAYYYKYAKFLVIAIYED